MSPEGYWVALAAERGAYGVIVARGAQRAELTAAGFATDEEALLRGLIKVVEKLTTKGVPITVITSSELLAVAIEAVTAGDDAPEPGGLLEAAAACVRVSNQLRVDPVARTVVTAHVAGDDDRARDLAAALEAARAARREHELARARAADDAAAQAGGVFS